MFPSWRYLFLDSHQPWYISLSFKIQLISHYQNEQSLISKAGLDEVPSSQCSHLSWLSTGASCLLSQWQVNSSGPEIITHISLSVLYNRKRAWQQGIVQLGSAQCSWRLWPRKPFFSRKRWHGAVFFITKPIYANSKLCRYHSSKINIMLSNMVLILCLQKLNPESKFQIFEVKGSFQMK